MTPSLSYKKWQEDTFGNFDGDDKTTRATSVDSGVHNALLGTRGRTVGSRPSANKAKN